MGPNLRGDITTPPPGYSVFLLMTFSLFYIYPAIDGCLSDAFVHGEDVPPVQTIDPCPGRVASEVLSLWQSQSSVPIPQHTVYMKPNPISF